MPKPLGYEPIHESNLVKGSRYFLRIKQWGEGIVQVEEIVLHGTTVEVIDGGFNTTLKKVTKGGVFTVPNDAGSWYEAKV